MTSTRPVPRPLQLISNTAPSGPSSAGAQGPRSAPLASDPSVRPAPRRQSSISYNTGAGLPRRSSTGAGSLKHESAAPARDSRVPPARDIEPATLAEKHADLLRFIAQKESRCLELRTQLAQHEADLLLLKRKWERIVSKGGPRPERSDVLDGIREGVQSGLGRVLAVLEPVPSPAMSMAGPRTATASASTSAAAHDKRTSVSRSSLASSTGSLFDDVAGLENGSSASSVSDSPVSKPEADAASAVSPRPSQAFKRNSYTFAPAPAEPPPLQDDDPSAKRRRVRPASVHIARPAAAGAQSPVLSPGTPLGRQVSAWVPELNRKWEELKSNETLSRQSKRASVLLSDVLAVLAPPAPSPFLRHAPSHAVLDSAFFDPATAASIGAGAGSRPDAAPRSLLDEDSDDDDHGGAVLQPEVMAPKPKKDDDEWNW